jgi:hypothetical protein
MKRMAGMQPYFFPYIGYWQLIDAVDCFVLFDEAQYIKQGWVNRNRILKPGGGWQYILVPVARHPRDASIRDVMLAKPGMWRTRILNQLAHYRKRAPFFDEAFAAIEGMLRQGDDESIGGLNCRIVREMCTLLSIDTEIIVSSEYPFDYSEVAGSGHWALAHAVQLDATELINPHGGFHLLDQKAFGARSIRLGVIDVPQITYDQRQMPFEPALSIIDVLMFNGLAGTRALLAQRRLIYHPQGTGSTT